MNQLLHLFNWVDRVLVRLLKPIVILLSLLISVGMVAGIVARSLLHAPMLGLEEIILFSVIWLYMLGAALASRDRSHLSADFVSVWVENQRVRAAFHLLATLISLVAVIAFVIWSYSLFAWGFEMRQNTPVFQLPFYLSQSGMFCASLLFLFYILRDLLQDLIALKGEEA